ncbi:MAG: urease accessory UreF family protein [Pseudomonadota bacterium]
MTTTTDLLHLTQWLSPAFPVSGFAYSHGLETAISAGQVSCGQTLTAWLEAILRFGSGHTDAVLLSLSHRTCLPDVDLADLAAALATSSERWDETRLQGAAFAQTVSALRTEPVAPAALPVVVGIAARDLGLPTHTVVALYLQGFAANLVQVGVRFVPLGQTEGQMVLSALLPIIAEIAETSATAGTGDLGNAAFGSDLAAMAHETQDVRIFRS